MIRIEVLLEQCGSNTVFASLPPLLSFSLDWCELSNIGNGLRESTTDAIDENFGSIVPILDATDTGIWVRIECECCAVSDGTGASWDLGQLPGLAIAVGSDGNKPGRREYW